MEFNNYYYYQLKFQEVILIYITFTFEGLIYWMELNNENYALRQIVLSADDLLKFPAEMIVLLKE